MKLRRLPTRPPIQRTCACGKPAPYCDAVYGLTRHLCHECWRDFWTFEVLEMEEA